MFVDYQNFTGSMGRNFVGNWFVVLQLWGRSNIIPKYHIYSFFQMLKDFLSNHLVLN